MKVYICKGCGAETKYKVDRCLCGRTQFYVEDRPEPTEVEQQSNKKYEEALQELEQYVEGCQSEQIDDVCEMTCCGGTY